MRLSMMSQASARVRRQSTCCSLSDFSTVTHLETKPSCTRRRSSSTGFSLKHFLNHMYAALSILAKALIISSRSFAPLPSSCGTLASAPAGAAPFCSKSIECGLQHRPTMPTTIFSIFMSSDAVVSALNSISAVCGDPIPGHLPRKACRRASSPISHSAEPTQFATAPTSCGANPTTRGSSKSFARAAVHGAYLTSASSHMTPIFDTPSADSWASFSSFPSEALAIVCAMARVDIASSMVGLRWEP
mmetsp:Transcript_18874/g.36454  ORF Transcript_18874/g.36454 Transcript_18874/m.36454 type:complete len:246 (-) Transcript_18874:1504-2241(-)